MLTYAPKHWQPIPYRTWRTYILLYMYCRNEHISHLVRHIESLRYARNVLDFQLFYLFFSRSSSVFTHVNVLCWCTQRRQQQQQLSKRPTNEKNGVGSTHHEKIMCNMLILSASTKTAMQFRKQQKGDSISREPNWLHLRRLLANDVPFFPIQPFQMMWTIASMRRSTSIARDDSDSWKQEFHHLAKLWHWNVISIGMLSSLRRIS